MENIVRQHYYLHRYKGNDRDPDFKNNSLTPKKK